MPPGFYLVWCFTRHCEAAWDVLCSITAQQLMAKHGSIKGIWMFWLMVFLYQPPSHVVGISATTTVPAGLTEIFYIWFLWLASQPTCGSSSVCLCRYRPAAVIGGFYNKIPFYYFHEQLSLCLAHEALFKDVVFCFLFCFFFLNDLIALKIVLYKICCKDL